MKRVRAKVTYQTFNFALSYIQGDDINDIDLRAESLPGSRPSNKKKLAHDRFVKGVKLYALHLPSVPNTIAIDVAEVIRLADSDEQLPVDTIRKTSRPALTSSDVNLPVKAKTASDNKKNSAAPKVPLMKKVLLKQTGFFERLADIQQRPSAPVQQAKKRKADDLPADINAGKKVKTSSVDATAEDAAVVNNKRKAVDDASAPLIKKSKVTPPPPTTTTPTLPFAKLILTPNVAHGAGTFDFEVFYCGYQLQGAMVCKPELGPAEDRHAQFALTTANEETSKAGRRAHSDLRALFNKFMRDQKALQDDEEDHAIFIAREVAWAATGDRAAKAVIAREASKDLAKIIAKEAALKADESRRDSAFDATFQVHTEVERTPETSSISRDTSPVAAKTSLKRSRDVEPDEDAASTDTFAAPKRQRTESSSDTGIKASSSLRDKTTASSPSRDRSETPEPAFTNTAPTRQLKMKAPKQQVAAQHKKSYFDRAMVRALKVVARINKELAAKKAAAVAKPKPATTTKAVSTPEYIPTHKEQGRRDGKSRRRYSKPSVWSIPAGEWRREENERREIEGDIFLQNIDRKALTPQTPHR